MSVSIVRRFVFVLSLIVLLLLMLEIELILERTISTTPLHCAASIFLHSSNLFQVVQLLKPSTARLRPTLRRRPHTEVFNPFNLCPDWQFPLVRRVESSTYALLFNFSYSFFGYVFVLIEILSSTLNLFPVFLGNRTAKSRYVGKVTLRFKR